jgi:hypothetical protein
MLMTSYETFIIMGPFLAYVAALTVGFGVAHYMIVKDIAEEEKRSNQKLKRILINMKRS